MRKRRLPNPAGKSRRLDPSVFFFSIAFFLGAVGGYFCCKSSGAGDEIKEYLARYAQVLVSGGAVTTASLLGAAVSYYRVPCAVYLCGVFRHAFYLICGVFLLEGFLLSFAVANFTLALGRTGVLVSLCVFGVRILMIFPVSIAVALRRIRSARERAGRRTARQKASSGRHDGRCLLFSLAILSLGVLAELTFVPKLVSLALQRLS